MKLPEAARKVDDGIQETLTYMGFPYQHWLKIRTNNVIERSTVRFGGELESSAAFLTANQRSCLYVPGCAM
jgi:transposase-like protein